MVSVPAKFLKTMDSVQQGIPNVICNIDDILVTGAADATQLCNMAKALHRLVEYEIRMKKAKCIFMKDKVEYL